VNCNYRLALVIAASICVGCGAGDSKQLSVSHAAGEDWPYYHGDPGGSHYSTLKEINTGNVARLTVAWTYDSGGEPGANSTIESNPLVVDGKMFFIAPNGRLISLDGSTGHERWVFDPGAGRPSGQKSWRRGVSYWSDKKERRILFTFGSDLYSIDAETGLVDDDFGSQGRIGLGANVSSPGVVYRNLIVMGGSSSSIRAFDIRSGELLWTFHTIPRPGEFGYETWPKDSWKTASGANNWAGLTLDAERGIVFVPLAFPRDFYGAQREGDNLFANCLVALDASTGRRLWHFQTIRHDVWDWDLPAAPTLVKVVRNGRPVDAVAQVSKVGFVYVLDRLTGKSLFPIIERPAFASDVPGAVMAKTQPEPLYPKPFARQRITVEMLTQRTPQANVAVAAQFATLRSRGLWDPPSEQGTIVFPGLEGGAEWGGAAYDPESGLLYVNSNELASILTLKKLSATDEFSGGGLYRSMCASCHGANRQGIPPDFPSLLGIGERLTFNQIATKIAAGGARMPGFQSLATDYSRLWPLVEYLETGIDRPKVQSVGEAKAAGHPKELYVLDGVPKFVDPEGYPATIPPWGTLNAIDPSTGQYAWKIPFGEYPELMAQGFKETGSENYGGPIVTAGGLLFIAATSFDKKFRAYDKRTGKLLWETVLPAAGNATPSTYRIRGKQFVVIAAGGGRPIKAESGTKIVAFALPN
jgi:quinoprotein glucose dehydrogenase